MPQTAVFAAFGTAFIDGIHPTPRKPLRLWGGRRRSSWFALLLVQHPAPVGIVVFLSSMLPQILTYASYAFRDLRGEARQDAIAEVVASCLVLFKALVQRGKIDLAYPTVLARYAVARFNDGRRVGNSLNSADVLSPYAQRLKGLIVDRLDRREKDDDNAWCEILIEDKTAGPAETAIARIDVDAWLKSLPRRDRKVAKFLVSATHSDAAAKFGVSDGRISQLRRSLERSWNAFGNEGNAA